MALTVDIHKDYEHVKVKANVPNAFSPIVELTIPSGRVYRIQEGIFLTLKLYKDAGVEIVPHSEVYLGWKPVIEETVFQTGRIMHYGIFRRIPIDQQENVETVARRRIEFGGQEIARVERGDKSIITGLTSDFKILLMLKSPDTVNWALPESEFSFDAIVLTELEWKAEMAARQPYIAGGAQ